MGRPGAWGRPNAKENSKDMGFPLKNTCSQKTEIDVDKHSSRFSQSRNAAQGLGSVLRDAERTLPIHQGPCQCIEAVICSMTRAHVAF